MLEIRALIGHHFFMDWREQLVQLNLDCIIIGGDWNCTLQFTLDRMNQEPHPQSSSALRKMIINLDLLDAWRVKYPSVKQYTWVRATDNIISAARRDRIYISKSIRSRLCHVVCLGFV